MYTEWQYNDELYHHGIMGQKWGVRRFQNPDGSLTDEGRKRYTVFVSGSSKTQDKNSGYYLRKLPKQVRKDLKSHMKNGDKIVVGDAPGVDRQVQNYLKKKHYKNVEVYGPGDDNKVRYSANKKWKQTTINSGKYKPDTDEWRAEKDKFMSKIADKGIAVVLENGGAGATRNNVKRMFDDNKDTKVYELSSKRSKFNPNSYKVKTKEKGARETAYSQNDIYDYFYKTKEGKAATRRDKNLGGLDKDYTYEMMEDLAKKDPKFRKMWRD